MRTIHIYLEDSQVDQTIKQLADIQMPVVTLKKEMAYDREYNALVVQQFPSTLATLNRNNVNGIFSTNHLDF